MNTDQKQNEPHRIESAAALFQKEIYHKFRLKQDDDAVRLKQMRVLDTYERVQHTYQAVKSLGGAMLLLNRGFEVTVNEGLALKLGISPPDTGKGSWPWGEPPFTGDKIDSAACITHGQLKALRHFPRDHPLFKCSQQVLAILSDANKARDNVEYRPMMQHKDRKPVWEDCTLEGLIGKLPSFDKLDELNKQFVSSMYKLAEKERREQTGRGCARYFFQSMFMPFEDRRKKNGMPLRPTETVLLTYGRMMNPDKKFLKDLRDYRNQLVNIPKVQDLINVDESSQLGQL